jgi:putative aldouronate transport system permease protein
MSIEMEHPEIESIKQNGGLEGYFRRIWKYRFHYFLVIPAMLLIFFFKLFPFVTAIYLPFVDFKIFKGIFHSAWIGLDNFKAMFADPIFRNALANTIVIKVEYILVCGVLAFILALALSSIKSLKLRSLFSMLFLIPYFIPSVIVAYLVMLLLSQNNNPFFHIEELVLANEDLFQPLLVVIEVVKTCGIPILMALAAIGFKQMKSNNLANHTGYSRIKVIPAARAIGAFMLLQLSTILTTDFELVNKLLNPLVVQTGETLDTYSFKMALMNGNYNIAGTLWLLQFVVQLMFTIIAYLLIRGIFTKDIFENNEVTVPKTASKGTNGMIGWAVTLLYSIVVLVPIFLLFIYPFFAHSTSAISLSDLFSISRFFTYVFINVAAVVVFLLITLTLAYPLTVKDLPGRNLYKVILLFVMGMGGVSLHEFMFVQDLGMINTVFPQMFYGFFSITSVFVLKSIFNGKYSALKIKVNLEGRGELHSFFYLFIPKIWKPLLALGILQFVALWNSYYPSFLYTSRQEQYSPIMHFHAFTTGMQGMEIDFSDPILLQYGALISLPSVLLLLIFRKWITSEVLVGQIRRL